MDTKIAAALQRLEQALPTLERSDVNERTLAAWRMMWIEGMTPEDIASKFGWSMPAVSWHLRRAARILRAE